MQFGFADMGDQTCEQIIDLAQLGEIMGFDKFWHCDERFERDLYVDLAAVAMETEEIGLGTSVTDPYFRHPLLTAEAIGTLDELSDGRANLGLGAGSHFEYFDIDMDQPIPALRDGITIIKDLFNGEEVTHEGEVIKLYGDGKLTFETRPDIPIYIATRGPVTLSLAGEIADGVIIGSLGSESTLEWAFDRIQLGIDKAGRDWDDITVASWLYCSISEDSEAAKDAVRRGVSHSLWSSRPRIHDFEESLETDFSDELWDYIESVPHEWSPEVMSGLRERIPYELIEELSMTGTPDEIEAKIDLLEGAGVDEVLLWPHPAEGYTLEKTIAEFGRRFL